MASAVTNAIVSDTNQPSIITKSDSLEIIMEEEIGPHNVTRTSPMNTNLTIWDKGQGGAVQGTTIKGWTMQKLAIYFSDFKGELSTSSRNGLTPRRPKAIPHKKASPPKALRAQKLYRPNPPPMSAFQVLRPSPPIGYERKNVDVPPGLIGIRVMMKNNMLTIYEVTDDSPIKHSVRVNDVIEGVDCLYEQKWDIDRFIEHVRATSGQKRTLQVFVKKNTPPNPVALSASSRKKLPRHQHFSSEQIASP